MKFRKTAGIMLVTILILLPVARVNATIFDKTFKIDDLGVTLTLPEMYYGVTRDVEDDDPALDVVSLSKSELLSYLESENIYFDACDSSLSFELSVIMTENDVTEDMNQLTEEELETTVDSLIVEYGKLGLIVTDSEIISSDQAKYIMFEITVTGTEQTDYYCKQYYTIYNGKALVYRMTNASGPITDEQETTLKDLVETVVYSTDPVSDRSNIEQMGEKDKEELQADVENEIEGTVSNFFSTTFFKVVLWILISCAIGGLAGVVIIIYKKKMSNNNVAANKKNIDKKNSNSSKKSRERIRQLKKKKKKNVKKNKKTLLTIFR